MAQEDERYPVKAMLTRFSQDDVSLILTGELFCHSKDNAVWYFQLWDKDREIHTWEGNLEELVGLVQLGLCAKQDFAEKMVILQNLKECQAEVKEQTAIKA